METLSPRRVELTKPGTTVAECPYRQTGLPSNRSVIQRPFHTATDTPFCLVEDEFSSTLTDRCLFGNSELVDEEGQPRTCRLATNRLQLEARYGGNL